MIAEFLNGQQVSVACYEILPDERDIISARLKKLADEEEFQLVFTTGGTGLGPRDVTRRRLFILDRTVPGIVEAIRRHGKEADPLRYALPRRSRPPRSMPDHQPARQLQGRTREPAGPLPGVMHIFPMMEGKGH